MVANPPAGYARVLPYLLYEDADAAVAWLVRVFGFRERLRVPGPNGKTTHAELELEGGVVLLGAPGADYKAPKRHGHVCHTVLVYVDDVDAHCARAKAAGAKIVDALTDKPHGDRMYRAADLEGQHWTFATHVRDGAV